MSDKLVPIELLPAAARAAVTPSHPAFAAYARQLEQQYNLPEGTLLDSSGGGTRWQLGDGADALGLLMGAAKDAAKESRPKPAAPGQIPSALPPGVKVPPKTGDPALQAVVDEMPTWERVAAGAGKAVHDVGNGVGQLLGMVPQSEIDDTARRDAPLLNTPAGFTGALLGGAGMAALPSTVIGSGGRALAAVPIVGRAAQAVAAPMGNAAATGAAYSGLMQPVESGSSRGGQAAVGALAGLLGHGLNEGVQSLVRPAKQGATAAVQALADKAEAAGIPLRAADVSPSKLLSGLQTLTDYLPFSGGHEQRAQASEGFTRALGRTLGEDSPDLTAALRAARTRNETNYTDLAARNVAELDPVRHGQILMKALNDFKRVDTSPNKQLTDQLDQYLANLADPANANWNAATGKFELPGDVYKQFRSEARMMAQSTKKGGETGSNPMGGQLSKFYNTVKTTLDDAMRSSSSITPEDKTLYALTDKQWGNMRTLERIAPKDASGTPDFSALARVLNQKDASNLYNRDAFVYGKYDQTLPDLARIGTTFLGKGAAPTSWKRMAEKAGDLAGNLAVPATIGGGLYSLNAHDPDPVGSTALELGALGLLSKGAGGLLNSRFLLRGAPSFVQGAARGAENLGLGRLPLGALNTMLRRAVPDASAPETFEEGATGR